MKIALISCSKDKKDYACPAKELYSKSALFSLLYQYAKERADKIYILSALHGLIPEVRVLAPYNVTLKTMSRQQQLVWAQNVIHAMNEEFDLQNDEFLILTGRDYYKDLIGCMQPYELPLQGLSMGRRMAYMKEQLCKNGRSCTRNVVLDNNTESLCLKLHKLFNQLPRYSWDQIPSIPFTNGIYIVFEKDEKYHGMDRVVRVGTHTADNRLKKRLNDHFVNEHHDGSIFRKNIGKAILNAHHDPYLRIWTLDTSKPANYKYIDKSKNTDTEMRVSKYMRASFTFTVFPVPTKDLRLRLEEAIIATLNQTPDFVPSKKWAGKYSPEEEIRSSGLWLKQGLYAAPLTTREFKILQDCCSDLTPITFKEKAEHENIQKKLVANSEYHGKYLPLYLYLLNRTEASLHLTFTEIEDILRFALPRSARTYPMWWQPGGTHTHCQSWIKAGYKASNIMQGIQKSEMLFVRR